jgi:drug/metabolite transporter (DMT)-like permease
VLIGVAAALLACFSYGTASVLQSYGARKSAAGPMDGTVVNAEGGPTLRSTVTAMLAPTFVVGMALDGLGFAGSLVSARLIPLFLSQTVMSANLVVTAVLSTVVLRIRLRTRDWAAIIVVLASLCILGFTAGQLGKPDRHIGLHWGVLLVSAVVLAIGIALVRLLGSRAAVAAGLFAGVLYGAMAVAVRIVHGLEPLRMQVMLVDPALWAILVAGGGGFYLFTVALQVGSVNGVAAALVVGETVVPGVIGVVLLGDSARPGYGGLVVLAFAAAVAGAVAISIFGASEPDSAPVPVESA